MVFKIERLNKVYLEILATEIQNLTFIEAEKEFLMVKSDLPGGRSFTLFVTTFPQEFQPKSKLPKNNITGINA